MKEIPFSHGSTGAETLGSSARKGESNLVRVEGLLVMVQPSVSPLCRLVLG